MEAGQAAQFKKIMNNGSKFMKDRNNKEYFSELGSQSSFDQGMTNQLKNTLLAAEKIRQTFNPNSIRHELV